jgi:hypothetical protein
MIYKFKSKATGDTILLGPQGDLLQRLLGREPAPQGIVEPAAMPAAIDALQRAIAEDDAARAGGEDPDDAADAAAGTRDVISLRRRMWPMVEMLKRAQAAGEPIVWGV